jgi:hypothetical protein
MRDEFPEVFNFSLTLVRILLYLFFLTEHLHNIIDIIVVVIIPVPISIVLWRLSVPLLLFLVFVIDNLLVASIKLDNLLEELPVTTKSVIEPVGAESFKVKGSC